MPNVRQKDYVARFPEFNDRSFSVEIDSDQPIEFVAEAAALGVQEALGIEDGQTITVQIIDTFTQSRSEFRVIVEKRWDARVL